MTKRIILGFFAILSLSAFQDGEWAASIESGAEVYVEYCITCHMAEGEGVPGAFPPLAKADYLMADIERAIGIVKYGQQGEIVVNGVTYNNYMQEIGLEDEEVRDVMNYILNSWGNQYERAITLEEVQAQ